MKIKITAITLMSLLLFSACNNTAGSTVTETLGDSEMIETSSDSTIPEESEVSETELPIIYEPTTSDLAVAEWFNNYIFDEEYFTDLKSYQYYARAIGQDKDYFLNADMWEVFYNDRININSDIDNLDIYIIRLDPNKLLELYSENNGLSVDELCAQLSITQAQLYYNWGYNPASYDYTNNHISGIVSYSEQEQAIFGIANGEDRTAVMSSHLLVIDREDGSCTYWSYVSDPIYLIRRDMLGAYTENGRFYGDFSDAEKDPAFRLNGIGIRCVIPLTLPNAYADAAEYGYEGITVMINTSPYSYGCTEEDKIDISGIIEILYQ